MGRGTCESAAMSARRRGHLKRLHYFPHLFWEHYKILRRHNGRRVSLWTAFYLSKPLLKP